MTAAAKEVADSSSLSCSSSTSIACAEVGAAFFPCLHWDFMMNSKAFFRRGALGVVEVLLEESPLAGPASLETGSVSIEASFGFSGLTLFGPFSSLGPPPSRFHFTAAASAAALAASASLPPCRCRSAAAAPAAAASAAASAAVTVAGPARLFSFIVSSGGGAIGTSFCVENSTGCWVNCLKRRAGLLDWSPFIGSDERFVG